MKHPDLILLHGALGAADQFQPWVSTLEQNFSLHFLSLEGHGPETTDRPFRIPHFAENLLLFIQKNGLEKPNVFGYSMGGYVALWLESEQPGTFEKIMTFGSKFHWDPETSGKEVRHLDPSKILEKVPSYAQVLKARHTGLGWEEVLRRTADMMEDLGQNPALTSERLGRVALPVRVGTGDRDTMVSVEETQRVFRQLAQASMLMLPETPHPLEKIPLQKIHSQIVDFFL